jgi:hypothetical protein
VVKLSPLGTLAMIWPIVLARKMDDDERGAVGGMICRGNRSTRRKPAPVPLFALQIRHGKPATNHLSYGSAYIVQIVLNMIVKATRIAFQLLREGVPLCLSLDLSVCH